MPEQRQRVGRNAPTEDEKRRVALFDRVHALLFERGYRAEDIAVALKVSLYQISHLRVNLQAYSFGQRQAAESILQQFFSWAIEMLEKTPDPGSTAQAVTLGEHLRKELAALRQARSSTGTTQTKE